MRRVLCNYYVTYRCNAKCGFCDFSYHEKYRNTGHAVLEDFLQLLPQLKKAGVRIIDFTGGEPLLNRDLPEMLKSTKKAGIMTTVTTNCLLYPKQAESIRGLVDLLHFSLDALDPELHNSIRGIDCYDHVLRSVDLALKLGERPDILFTVTEKNFHEMDDIHRYASSKGLILILNPVFSYFRKESLPDIALDLMEKTAEKPFVYVSQGFINLRRAGGNNPDKPLCKAVSKTIVISPENELLLPCYHRCSDKIPINGNLEAAMKTDTYKKHLEQEGRMSFCRGCIINCYFEPSFAFSFNRYMWTGLRGKLKYTYTKYVKQPLILKGRQHPVSSDN